MSTILNKVSQTNQAGGIRAVIAGVEKVGKTTFCCSAPKALLVPLENGYMGVTVEKTPMLTTFVEVMGLLDEIINAAQKGQFPYKTIVFDSGTALERLIHDKTLSTDPLWKNGNLKGLIMDNALGGYGKAYNFANELFAKFLEKCDMLATNGGINIVITCHVFAGKVIDPAFGEYDTWDLLLHSPKNNKTYGKREMITQWADLVGFLHEPMYISKIEGSDLSMGINANKGRILGIERTPAYIAGNRFGMKGEIAVPPEQSWNYLAHQIFESCGLDVYNR